MMGWEFGVWSPWPSDVLGWSTFVQRWRGTSCDHSLWPRLRFRVHEAPWLKLLGIGAVDVGGCLVTNYAASMPSIVLVDLICFNILSQWLKNCSKTHPPKRYLQGEITAPQDPQAVQVSSWFTSCHGMPNPTGSHRAFQGAMLHQDGWDPLLRGSDLVERSTRIEEHHHTVMDGWHSLDFNKLSQHCPAIHSGL